MPSPAASFALPFLRKEQLTADTYSFYFDRTAHPFEYLPGQYIRMILMHENPDERGTSRFFTMASPPTEHEELMITTRVVQSSFKKALLGLLPGQEVQFWGPIGQFVLHEDTQKPLVFLAGGIGLTPYHSMLLYGLEKKIAIPMTLFVACSTSEEIVFYEELTAVTKQLPTVTVVYTVTHPEESQTAWVGETGRISVNMLKKYVSAPQECIYYISGPGAMVDATEKMLSEMDVSEEHIVLEKFPGY